MEIDGPAIVVGAAIVVTWIGAQAWTWGRAGQDRRLGLAEHMGQRLTREWALLVVLLAPLVVRSLPLEAGRWVFVVLAVIAAWWLLERLGELQQRMRATRDPLRCARLAARRLGRNRWLLGALVVFWLASWAGNSLEWSAYFVRNPDRGRAAAAGAPSWAERLASATNENFVAITLMHALEERFPNAMGEIGGGFALIGLAAVVGFGYLRFGSRLPAEQRERMAWPFRLTVLYVLVTAETHLWWLRPSQVMPWGASPLSRVAWVVGLLAFLWSAPSTAALWHLLLQVVRGQRVDPWRALRDAAETWPLFVPLLLIMTLPAELAMLAVMFWPRGDVGHLAQSTLYVAGQIVPLALMLVPWLIVDRRIGLRRALATAWSFVTERPMDLFAFVVRFTATMAVLWTVVGLFAPHLRHSLLSLTDLVRFLTIGPLELLGTLSVGVLYLALSEADRRQARSARAGKPSSTGEEEAAAADDPVA